MLNPIEDCQEPTRTDEPRVREIVRNCHQRLGRPLSPHDVEELIQDTMVAAWSSDRSFRAEGPRDAWVYSIARHLLLRRLRVRQARIGREEALVGSDVALASKPSGSSGAFGTGTAEVIRGAFVEAGTTVDTIFRLHDVDGETFGRIADTLGMKETAVKGRYYRSIPNLRRRLSSLFGGPGR